MSYLNPIRLHFAGQFQADVSTVNNTLQNFDNDTFASDPVLSWNPGGGASFRLIGCTVTSVGYADGTTSTSDPIVGMEIAGANSRVAAKLVDLDTQQQGVSQIWGLTVRLTNGSTDLFSGPFAMAPFSDMWPRAQGSGAGGDFALGAFFQSVLTPVTWGDDPSGSKLLQELRCAAADGLLSIKFNVDGFNAATGAPGFTLGRCVGTIGPASADEPQHFVIGRQLFSEVNPAQGMTTGPMNFMPCVVDPSGLIYADLGNALPTDTPGGNLTQQGVGTIAVGWLDGSNNFNSLATLDPKVYTASGWYAETAGVYVFTADVSNLATNRLAITAGGNVVLQENLDGLHVRADLFVFRLDPGQPASVNLYATQYGVLTAGIPISVAADPNGLSGGPSWNAGDPADAITLPQSPITSVLGPTVLTIGSSDPKFPRTFDAGPPRIYIDGQVYGVRCLPQAVAAQIGNPPTVETESNPPPTAFGYNPWDFISILLWSGYSAPAQPTWAADMQPIFQQYANLYPLMQQMFDLSDYDSVVANAGLLSFAFNLPPDDPNYMPVTRDLSTAKRQAILAWLQNPVQGTAPAAPAPRAMVAKAAAVRMAEDVEEIPLRDAKTRFLHSRLVNSRRR